MTVQLYLLLICPQILPISVSNAIQQECVCISLLSRCIFSCNLFVSENEINHLLKSRHFDCALNFTHFSEILLYLFSHFSLCIFNILITNLLFYNIKNMPTSLSYSEKIKKNVKKKLLQTFLSPKLL